MAEHSAKRRGRRVVQNRTAGAYRKSIHDLDELFQRFHNAKTAEGLAKGTLEKYGRYYRFFADYLDNNGLVHDIRNVTVDLLREFIVWSLEERVKFDGHKYKPDESKTKGLSPRTVNDRLKLLRTFFNFLVDEGLTDENPASAVKNVKVEDDEIIVLTSDQLKALLNAPDQRKYADFRDYVLMTFLLDGFCRINEALSIKKSDVDFASDIVTIRASVAKNRKSRAVPIQKRTSKLLRELVKETEDFDSDYIFLANYGEPLTSNHFRKQLKKYAEKAGIKTRVHPHLFRHTAATMALEAGMDIRHLQMLLGHSDLRMVMRYTHLSKKSLVKQHAQYSPLNEVLGKLNKGRKIKR